MGSVRLAGRPHAPGQPSRAGGQNWRCARPEIRTEPEACLRRGAGIRRTPLRRACSKSSRRHETMCPSVTKGGPRCSRPISSRSSSTEALATRRASFRPSPRWRRTSTTSPSTSPAPIRCTPSIATAGAGSTRSAYPITPSSPRPTESAFPGFGSRTLGQMSSLASPPTSRRPTVRPQSQRSVRLLSSKRTGDSSIRLNH